MPAKTYCRGHEIKYDERTKTWIYCDTLKVIDNKRPCKRCGENPTREGHDACLGNLKDVSSACCGHGVEFSYRKK